MGDNAACYEQKNHCLFETYGGMETFLGNFIISSDKTVTQFTGRDLLGCDAV